MKTGLVIPGITDGNTLACLSRATRKYSQYCGMVENALKGKCPFCTPDPKRNPTIIEADDWRVWSCNPPEANTRFHFLFVPTRHVTGISELTTDERLGLFDLMDQIKDGHGITSCGILIRDGDATLSAGTVQHLHIHMMVPDGTGRVESPFYKGAESEAESMSRAIVFEKIRQGASVESLNADEKKLIEGRM
jgi:diadenosine tetraphosphate (Ap4A) HIT family hydrolase